MKTLITDSGVILSNAAQTLSELDEGYDLPDTERDSKIKVNHCNVGLLKSPKDFYFFKIRRIDITPFHIYSGADSPIQCTFFDKIHNSSFLNHSKLDKELLELYSRLLKLKDYSNLKCIQEKNGLLKESIIARNIAIYRNHCEKPEDNIQELSELANRIYSEEIELKMYEFIKEVSLEWRPPTRQTLIDIWNDEKPIENQEVQLISVKKIQEIEKYWFMDGIIADAEEDASSWSSDTVANANEYIKTHTAPTKGDYPTYIFMKYESDT